MIKHVRQNFKTLSGCIEIPADKSISHRAVIFSLLAQGRSLINNFADCLDTRSSLHVCSLLGADIDVKGATLIINPPPKLRTPKGELNCGNSGTTMRLLAGILAGQNFSYILTGDESLSMRPMKRIIRPLEFMGADIKSQDFHAPIKIFGRELHGINYKSEIASAQVKSCVLLAGLGAQGKTIYTEPYLSRNHSEIILKQMGAKINISGLSVSVEKSELNPLNTEITGDISSAAYFIAAAVLIPNSDITIKHVGLNQTRTGIIDVLKKMGANIEIFDKHEICGEMTGNIRVIYSPGLDGCEISGEIIPRLIDEIPIIAVVAALAHGTTVIKDAEDLKNKESNRIACLVSELKKLGANIEETPDGMIIRGKDKLCGNCLVDSFRDHRLAMSLYVAGLLTDGEISIKNFDCVNISFPNFEKSFDVNLH